jgi:hypothetical protein
LEYSSCGARYALEQVLVLDEVVHRHELDRRDAERLEVVDHRRVGHAGVRPAQLLGELRVARGEALDVDLVDDRLVPGRARRPIGAPVEERVRDHGARHEGRAVVVVAAERLAEHVREHGGVPLHGAVDRLGVGVEQQLVRVAAVSLARVPGAVHAEAVALARPYVGQVAVPAVGVDLGQRDALLLAVRVEEAELHALRQLREQREVGPRPVVGGPERVRVARPDLHAFTGVPPVARPARRPSAERRRYWICTE